MSRVRFYLFMIVILLVSVWGGLSWLGNKWYPAIRFVETGGERARMGITKFIAHWRSVENVYRELDLCTSENQELKRVRAELALLEKDARDVKALAHFVERQRGRMVTARVHGFGIPGEHQGYFDAGKKEGVAENYPVIAVTGNVVGVVSRVEDDRSVITFLSSPELSLPVTTTYSLAAIGVTQGGRGNEVSLGYIPPQTVLTPNTEVFIPSNGTILERELYVGYIDSVMSNPSEIFQSATVVVAEPFNSISKASVFIP